MREILLRKGMVFSVVCLFLLTGFSSVYAELNVTSRTVETSVPIEMESEISYTYLNKHGLREQYYYHHFENNYPLRKPKMIDGEDWDFIVPDHYSTIQMAIDNSEESYRIFVRAGIYKENIVIDTDGIIIHGENKETTVIDGNKNNNVVEIVSNYCNISAFSIKNSGNDYSGIKIFSSSGNLIQDNILLDNSIGVSIISSSHANNITANIITENIKHGIVLSKFSSGNTIYNNVISENIEHGITIDNVSRGNTINWNIISYNKVGINVSGISDGNLFHHNNLVNNDLNAYDSSDNGWDNGIEGNYWSDYIGEDDDGNEVGDVPYLVPGGGNRDGYPLMNPFTFHELLLVKYTENRLKNESEIKPNTIITEGSFSGNTIVVPDDYPTIQEAVNNAYDGDRIEVRPGIYYENIVVDKSIQIIGDGVDVTFVNGSYGNTHVFNIKGNSVEISGFTITNTSNGFSGIRLYGASCNIHDNVLVSCGGGVELWNSKDNIVHNNTMTGNLWGIYAWKSQDCQINNNLMIHNGYGIEQGFSSFEIIGNTIENNSLKGILQIQCNQTFIQENSISFNDDIGLQMFSSHSNEIMENTITNNNKTGISIYKSTNNNVNNNIIQNHTTFIHLQDVFGIQFVYLSNHNNIYDNELISNDVGVGIYSSENNKISNNNFSCPMLLGTATAIKIYFSNINKIKGNNIIDYWQGIKIWDGYLNTVYGNNITGPGMRVYGTFIFGLFLPSFIFLEPALFGIMNVGWENLFFYNNISEQLEGIWTYGGSSINKIKGNNIYSNFIGIEVEAPWPNFELSPFEISYNNFIGNKIHARFMGFGLGYLLSDLWWIEGKLKYFPIFDENYWNRARLHPKTIHGRLGSIPWIMFDKHPSKKSYDITNLTDLVELDQYQIQSIDPPINWYNCWDNIKLAQSFIPSLESILRVDLAFWKAGNPESLKLSIVKNLSGDDLTSIYIPAIQIPEVPIWIEFDFTNIHLIPGEEYYIVWEPNTYDISNTFLQAVGYNNQYSKGSAWIFQNDKWEKLIIENHQDIDFCFKTWGN